MMTASATVMRVTPPMKAPAPTSANTPGSIHVQGPSEASGGAGGRGGENNVRFDVLVEGGSTTTAITSRGRPGRLQGQRGWEGGQKPAVMLFELSGAVAESSPRALDVEPPGRLEGQGGRDEESNVRLDVHTVLECA